VPEDRFSFHILISAQIHAAGHRLSTEAIEEIIAAHPNVAECAVIGASDKLKGEGPARSGPSQDRNHSPASGDRRRFDCRSL